MAYKRSRFQGDTEDGTQVVDWITGELEEVEKDSFDLDLIRFVTQNVAPDKPRTGDTRLADGTHWNPGSGAGVYTYYGAAWHKLG